MKTLIIILIVWLVLFVGIFIGIGICLATGKLTYDDLDKMVKREKERKAKKSKCVFRAKRDFFVGFYN